MTNPCPICGRLNDSRHAFCIYCGHPLSSGAAMPEASAAPAPSKADAGETAPKPAKRERKKNTAGFFIGLGAVLVILGIAAAVVTIYLSGSADEPQRSRSASDRAVGAVLDGDCAQALGCMREDHASSIPPGSVSADPR